MADHRFDLFTQPRQHRSRLFLHHRGDRLAQTLIQHNVHALHHAMHHVLFKAIWQRTGGRGRRRSGSLQGGRRGSRQCGRGGRRASMPAFNGAVPVAGCVLVACVGAGRCAITAGGWALGNGGRALDTGADAAALATGRATGGRGDVITVVREGPVVAPCAGNPPGVCTTSVRVGTKRGGARGGCCGAISRLSTRGHGG